MEKIILHIVIIIGKVRIYVTQNHGPDKGYHVLADKSFETFLPPRQALRVQYKRFNLILTILYTAHI